MEQVYAHPDVWYDPADWRDLTAPWGHKNHDPHFGPPRNPNLFYRESLCMDYRCGGIIKKAVLRLRDHVPVELGGARFFCEDHSPKFYPEVIEFLKLDTQIRKESIERGKLWKQYSQGHVKIGSDVHNLVPQYVSKTQNQLMDSLLKMHSPIEKQFMLDVRRYILESKGYEVKCWRKPDGSARWFITSEEMKKQAEKEKREKEAFFKKKQLLKKKNNYNLYNPKMKSVTCPWCNTQLKKALVSPSAKFVWVNKKGPQKKHFTDSGNCWKKSAEMEKDLKTFTKTLEENKSSW